VQGDCGAWVVEASTGDIFGHIVAGRPGSHQAYIIPAYKVIADIENTTGLPPIIPCRQRHLLGPDVSSAVGKRAEIVCGGTNFIPEPPFKWHQLTKTSDKEPSGDQSQYRSLLHQSHRQTDEAIGDRRLDLMPQPHSPSKIRKLKCRIIFWALMVPFTAFLSQYVYQVLLVDHPYEGILFFSPTDTNLVITIFGQVLAQLILTLFVNIFDVLRWQLASREQGVSISTFIQLSGATGWLGVLCLAVIRGSHHVWGLHR
jgi:hypothetical protein